MADLEDKEKAEKLAAGRKRVSKDTWIYVFILNSVWGVFPADVFIHSSSN